MNATLSLDLAAGMFRILPQKAVSHFYEVPPKSAAGKCLNTDNPSVSEPFLHFPRFLPSQNTQLLHKHSFERPSTSLDRLKTIQFSTARICAAFCLLEFYLIPELREGWRGYGAGKLVCRVRDGVTRHMA